MDYALARHNMIESQLRTNKVTDLRVLEAFAEIPREHFVPEPKRGIAYVDEDIRIGPGRCLMEPMVLARLLQAAQVEASDMALDIGSGTGYASAILARLAATVVSLESQPDLHEAAGRALHELAIDNAITVRGELVRGYPEQAPYNVILISGAVGAVPDSITGQLAEGGRLITVRKEGPGIGRALITRRSEGIISSRVLFDASTPLLPEFEPAPGFVF